MFAAIIVVFNILFSTPLPAKIRVENLHYEITEDDLHVWMLPQCGPLVSSLLR